MASKGLKDTPMMQQYNRMKEEYPDAILLFRVGDFYEAYGKDAVTIASALQIVLTKKGNGKGDFTEMAGVPYHAVDGYLARLIRAGHRVAVCDQLENPKYAKGLVKRGITELITPGTALADTLLMGKSNNFLCGLAMGKTAWGVSFVDLSTGDFWVAEGDADYIEKLVIEFEPKEIVFDRRKKTEFQAHFLKWKGSVFEMEDWAFSFDTALERLKKQFSVLNLKGFGIDQWQQAQIAAGAVLNYFDMTHHTELSHLLAIRRIEEKGYVRLDRFTIRNLELLTPSSPEGRSLFDVIDRSVSPGGGRMLRRWLLLPLCQLDKIHKRQKGVKLLLENRELQEGLDRELSRMGDLERLASKLALKRINPREVLALKVALEAVEGIKVLFGEYEKRTLLTKETDEPDEREGEVFLEKQTLPFEPPKIISCKEAIKEIKNAIREDAPMLLSKGGIFKNGVDKELDEVRGLLSGNKQYLLELQDKLAKETGISSLKISYNGVFGYFIEVRNNQKNLVPETWVRKQTIVNAERYVTPELKEYETTILGAEEKILSIEQRLFEELLQRLGRFLGDMQRNALIVSQWDCLLSMAKVAKELKYTCPEVNEGYNLEIEEGRHPVIETQMPAGEHYVANSLSLNREDCQIMMITGPNMAGKSALLRQTALIVLLAQMGSFVPAKHAKIGLIDKIFTRVGASDNISIGESTFMVEMSESAAIINNMTEKSLLLFDELGRGTSTYDGISIARAIVEYLHEHPTLKPKTLFATHYHELNEMEGEFERIKNFNVSVREVEGKVIFMRKLQRGGSEHSFGIHVAEMAGMPKSIVQRAEQILESLEEKPKEKSAHKVSTQEEGGTQLSLFTLGDPVLEKLRDDLNAIDLNNLTPLEALNAIAGMKKEMEKG